MYVKVNISNLLMNITLHYYQYIKNATADLLMISFTPRKGHITDGILYSSLF